MKRSFLYIVFVSLIAFLIPPAKAADTFAGTGTDVGTTLCYFVASASPPGKARVSYINATSDKAASVIQFYTAGSPILVTATSAASQTTINAPGTGNVTASDVIVLRSVANDTYQRLTVSSVTSTTIVAGANLTFALAAGDAVYKMTTAGSIPVGAATKELNAGSGSIYNGQEAKPLLVEIDGTSACQVNTCAGFYDR